MIKEQAILKIKSLEKIREDLFKQSGPISQIKSLDKQILNLKTEFNL
jgi:hypothetical protein